MAASMIVTGSSGFIGAHLCQRLAAAGMNGALRGVDVVPAAAGAPYPTAVADITDADGLRAAAPVRPDTVCHLAAKADVVIPLAELPELNTTNVNGTINVLTAFSARRVLFASSSAVYGNGARPSVDTRWSNVNPLGAYGMTKAAAELACGDWARETGGSVFSFRFGNVIGPRCRGFIPYLVAHARRHPDGSVAAPIRAGGTVVRDYVPVSYVVDIFERAAAVPAPRGAARAFNIGSQGGRTNGEVASVVQSVLREHGYTLRVDASLPLEPGESEHVVLDMTDTVRMFDAPAPARAVVDEAIAAAVRWWLDAA